MRPAKITFGAKNDTAARMAKEIILVVKVAAPGPCQQARHMRPPQAYTLESQKKCFEHNGSKAWPWVPAARLQRRALPMTGRTAIKLQLCAQLLHFCVAYIQSE